jgi:hypothetical protein
MIFQIPCTHWEAVKHARCVICKRRRAIRDTECVCFRVAGRVGIDGVLQMETFLMCMSCYDSSMCDYFDYADNDYWKNSYFQFSDTRDNMFYQFDNRFLCLT